MDRHAEFATQLARLVALQAHGPEDRVAEKAALRAARGASKHGVVELCIDEGQLLAGGTILGDDASFAPEMRAAFLAGGLRKVTFGHHLKQVEIKGFADFLARLVRGALARDAVAQAVADMAWHEITVDFVSAAVAEDEVAAGEEAVAAPSPVPADVPAPASEPTAAEAPTVSSPADGVPDVAMGAEAVPLSGAGPLATTLPPSAAALTRVGARAMFERLISASEPMTLRRFLEPIQAEVESAARQGRPDDSLRLMIAMLDCEELTADAEMRRQFVVALRRLTKPTLLRSLAALFLIDDLATDAERLLLRLGDDGAEAVIDGMACAPDAATRERYASLLGRLPTANDAIVEMLDDEAPGVIERGAMLLAQFRKPNTERPLGDLLGHAAVRVRRAAVQALAAFTESAFAIDALLRALQDASPEVRYAAAVALQSRRDAKLAPALVSRVDEEPESDVLLALITALGRLGAPEGVHKLVALASADGRVTRRKDGPAMRLAAIEALGEARTPAAMVTLQKLLEDREPDVREAAARLYSRARRQTSTGQIAVVSGP